MVTGRRAAPVLAACAMQGLWAAPALGHASERGQIMLLPTGLYMLGGGLAVLASVLLMLFLPAVARWKAPQRELSIANIPPVLRNVTSLSSLVLLSLLVFAGFFGPADPISNPLPGFIWSLWWFGFTLLCLLVGNLWPLFNPWTGFFNLIGPSWPLLRYPAWLSYWPAVGSFFAFAWFELVYPAADDPPRLGIAITAYFAVNLCGLLLFGQKKWMRKAEAFSVYFRMVGKLSPLQWSITESKLRVQLGLPGHGLLWNKSVNYAEAVFILLALATVSFDGFSQTFFWVDSLGLNPLEFPGRSAVILDNTVGLGLMALGLSIAYAVAVVAGSFITRTLRVPGLVLAIVPIALAYHFAHYLPDFPVDALKVMKALSDPFGSGLNLFGTADINPPASIMMDYKVATWVYRLQTAIIVMGHIMAVAIAHLLSLQSGIGIKRTVVSQAPLNSLMVLYTIFGLWLLSTPVIS